MNNTKTCCKCKLEKTHSEFHKNKSKKDGLQLSCKECHNQYTRRHYENNKQPYLDRASKKALLAREWMREYKSGLRCSKCPENHVSCLHFHHLDPSKKTCEVSKGVARGWTEERMMKEINKCIVLCANCHAKLHYNDDDMLV